MPKVKEQKVEMEDRLKISGPIWHTCVLGLYN